MKKNRLITLIAAVILMLTFSLDASAWWPSRQCPPPKPPSSGVVNAPLDGGLLTILGMAGVAYFIIRRKKK